jgi:hypothetical protein
MMSLFNPFGYVEDPLMGARRIRREQRQADMVASRAGNSPRKTKERQRRHARLIEALRNGKPPYSPTVRSWLSAELGKPSTKISQEDIQRLLA